MSTPLARQAAFLLAFLTPSFLRADAKPSPTPPGVVIAHVPAATQTFVGSPSIAVLPDGTYLASHDLFGPRTTEHVEATSRVYRSADRGQSWERVSEIKGAFWSTLFVHKEAVYLIGTTAHHGKAVIRRSTDGGRTWTTPADGKTGLLLDGQYHCAPVPVLVHNNRLWRAIEDAAGGTQWGQRYRAMMLSAPVDADLLDAKSWTASNHIARDPAWLGGRFNAWLEGNAVVDPDGKIVDVLRVDLRPEGQTAAVVRLSDDGKTATFDPARNFVRMPGGAVKFTIRRDERTKRYWSLVNDVLDHDAGGIAASTRNTVALVSSPNLRTWTVHSYVMHHPDAANHGFQYIDWLFDGDDLIAACRTAYDEPGGGGVARNFHDANYLTFHRVERFRERSMADSVPIPRPEPARLETADFLVTGYRFGEGKLAADAKAFANRNYVWQEVPTELAGATIAQTSGGERARVTVTTKRDATLYVATSAAQKGADLRGFDPTDLTFRYTDGGRTQMRVYRRAVRAGEAVPVPQGNWSGTVVILPPPPPPKPSPATKK